MSQSAPQGLRSKLPLFVNSLSGFSGEYAIDDEPLQESEPADADVRELLRQARAGSDDATARLLTKYRRYLEVIGDQELHPGVRRKLGTSAIVQEAVLQAHQSIASFAGDSEPEFRQWLRRILMNEVVDAARHFGALKRELRREEDLDSRVVRPDALATPRSAALAGEEARLLDEAMARLPDEYAQVIRLRNWENLSLAETGARMNRSPEAARKLWARAIERLRRELQGHDDRDPA